MKSSLNLHFLNTYQGKHANTHAGMRSHTTPATHTNSTPCSCLWMNRSLSLNWWSDKVGLNSRRHTGTHCRGRNMCFTSRAPSYTRANVTVCMRARACVRTRVQHVFAISYQLLISLQQRRGDWVKERERTTARERERERRHSVRESDNHSVNGAGEGPEVIPYLSFLPLLTLFRTASLLFPASGGEGACEHKLPALV